jgi:hypothetical protein
MKDFYIGQEVVCIKPIGQLVKDRAYTVKAIRQEECGCGGLLLDVGLTIPRYYTTSCMKCDQRYARGDGIAWKAHTRFTPLDELADIRELTEILEQKIEL